MNYLKKLGFSFAYIILSIFVLTLLITVFSYFNIISDKTVSIFKIAIPIISLFIGGFYMGKRSKKSGYIEGLKLGFAFSIFLLIFNFLAFNNSFKVKYILFYIILIATSILGSMIGINRKKNEDIE